MFFLKKRDGQKRNKRSLNNFKVGFFLGWMFFGGLYALWVALWKS